MDFFHFQLQRYLRVVRTFGSFEQAAHMMLLGAAQQAVFLCLVFLRHRGADCNVGQLFQQHVSGAVFLVHDDGKLIFSARNYGFALGAEEMHLARGKPGDGKPHDQALQRQKVEGEAK